MNWLTIVGVINFIVLFFIAYKFYKIYRYMALPMYSGCKEQGKGGTKTEMFAIALTHSLTNPKTFKMVWLSNSFFEVMDKFGQTSDEQFDEMNKSLDELLEFNKQYRPVFNEFIYQTASSLGVHRVILAQDLLATLREEVKETEYRSVKDVLKDYESLPFSPEDSALYKYQLKDTIDRMLTDVTNFGKFPLVGYEVRLLTIITFLEVIGGVKREH